VTTQSAGTSTATTTTAFIYDNNGNLTAQGTANGTTTYTWDYRNRITQAGTGSATSTYGYDYAGSRVLQTTAGVASKYINTLYSITGATTTKHIYAEGVLIATVEKSNNGTTTFIVHQDHLGGTNVVTDASDA
jgi:YD repeat-containing protein